MILVSKYLIGYSSSNYGEWPMLPMLFLYIIDNFGISCFLSPYYIMLYVQGKFDSIELLIIYFGRPCVTTYLVVSFSQ